MEKKLWLRQHSQEKQGLGWSKVHWWLETERKKKQKFIKFVLKRKNKWGKQEQENAGFYLCELIGLYVSIWNLVLCAE